MMRKPEQLPRGWTTAHAAPANSTATRVPRLVRPPVAVLLLTFTTVALAQFPGGGTGGRGGMGGAPPWRGAPDTARDAGAGGPRIDPIAQLAQNIADLESELGLKPDQLGAWNRYAERLRRFADDIVRNRATLGSSRETAPRQLDLVTAAAANRLTAIEDAAEAGKALYALLTPEQREVADRRLVRLVVPLVAGDPTSGPSRQGAGGTRGESPPNDAGGPPRR
jgi:hypothetical protein